MEKQPFSQLRNETIYLIHKHTPLKNMEISKLEVQHLDKSMVLLRIQRGERIFRVSLTPKITNNLKLLIHGKEFNDYIFHSRKDVKKRLSHTMIKKIIDNYNPYDIKEDIKLNKFTVKPVACEYGICKDGVLIDSLVLNNYNNAKLIANILNED